MVWDSGPMLYDAFWHASLTLSRFLTSLLHCRSCLPEKPYGRLILGQPASTTAGQRECARLLFCSSKVSSRRNNVQQTQSVPSLFSLIVSQGGNQAATR